MKLTKEALKRIIKEELDAVINEQRQPYETENFRRLSAYGKVGKNAQERIRKLYAAGRYAELGELSSYAGGMDIRSQEYSGRGRNEFGFAIPQEYIDPERLERTREDFRMAFWDAHTNRPKSATPKETPAEKPGIMDKIKGFFKEE